MNDQHDKSAKETGRPHVIALHSSAATGRQWAALAEQLAEHFVVHTPDLHGHGQGPAWAGNPAGIVAADSNRVARLAATVANGVHLVGHSYGGAIALRVALHHADRVRSVAVFEPVAFRVLTDADGVDSSLVEVAMTAQTIGRELENGSPERAARTFVDYWAGPGSWLALPHMRQEAVAARMPAVHAHFHALLRDRVCLDDYRSLRVPLLCLEGASTRAPTRAIVERLRSRLPNAEFERMDGVGHMGPMSHPDLVARRLERHLHDRAREDIPGRERVAA